MGARWLIVAIAMLAVAGGRAFAQTQLAEAERRLAQWKPKPPIE
jgi:hypothetical protein